MQFNLDQDRGAIRKAEFKQDYRECFASCALEFTAMEKCEFDSMDTILFLDCSWHVISYRRTSFEAGYVYSVLCVPELVCKVVTEKYSDVKALASALELTLHTELSNYIFPFPLRNVLFGHLLAKYRWESIETNAANYGNSLFLFYDSRGLICRTHNGLLSTVTYDFVPLTGALEGNYSFLSSFENFALHLDSPPMRYRYGNFVGNYIGNQVEWSGPGTRALILGNKYKLHSGNQDLDSMELILIKQVYDHSRQADPWTYTFGELRV